MTLLKRLKRAESGSAAVEFALLGPIMIGMMGAVLQLGMTMWSYNSLRSIASDTARYAVVNYQASNKLTDDQIKAYAIDIASASPYGLTGSRVTITVETEATSRVSGASERAMTINYENPTLFSLIGFGDLTLSFSRPIFLVSS